MRLFYALPLPADLRAVLAGCQEGLRARGLRASWPDPAGLHLTLAFLGEVEEGRLPQLLDLGAEVAGGQAPLDLCTTALGGFPRDEEARVLWVGVEPEPPLGTLAAQLGTLLEERGFPMDDRPFRPHLTLARPKAPTDLASFGPGPAPRGFQVLELHLMESLRDRQGTEYRSRGRWPLQDREPLRR